MIAKSRYKNLVSIFLLVLTIILSCTSVFATEPSTRANGWDENTHQSLSNIWEKYTIEDGSCDGTFRPDGTCSNEYSCRSCGGKTDICGPVKCDRCDGFGRHMGWCYSCSVWHDDGFDAVHRTEKRKGDFIGTVSSTNTSAYPNNAMQGDYWYVYRGRVSDLVAPTLNITKTIDANSPSYAGQAVTVTASATDNLSGVQGYSWNGGSLTTSTSFVVSASTGQTTVSCRVKDNAGNWSATRQITVKTITNQPDIDIDISDSSIIYGDHVVANATGGASNLGNTFTYEIISGEAVFSNNAQSITASGNVTITPRNISPVKVKVTKKGNSAWYDKSVEFTIQVAPKPISVQGAISYVDKVYDSNTATGIKENTLALNGVVFDDDVVLSSPVGVFADKNVGEHQILVSNFSISGRDISKYIFTQQLYDITFIA